MYNFLSNEIPGTTGTAHSAHLGGMLAAVLFYRFGMGLELRMPGFLRQRRIVRTASHKKTVQPTDHTVSHGDNDALQREVDRILDKINAKGFGSLSPKEKQTLDQAKDILRR
ncbi:MAG: hypothetical protein OSA95_00875 [Opitutales bacterium]|nr:hypothetical protein [Opitutales bacterium]